MSWQDMNLLIIHNMMGYIIWFFTILAISAIPQKLVEEKAIGTYEHLNMSSARIESIFMLGNNYNIHFSIFATN